MPESQRGGRGPSSEEWDEELGHLERLAGPSFEGDLQKRLESGGEHTVYLDGKNVLKITPPGGYGLVATVKPDYRRTWNSKPEPVLDLREGLPSEYLDRWHFMNEVFHDAAKVRRVEKSLTPYPRIVLEQPYIPQLETDPPIEEEEIVEFMQAYGFEVIPPQYIRFEEQWGAMWYREDGLMVSDAVPRNFRRVGRVLVPIDLGITRWGVPGKKQFWQK